MEATLKVRRFIISIRLKFDMNYLISIVFSCLMFIIHITDWLQQFFGFSKFRPYQKEIVESILGGQDCLVVMATGSGKSLW